MRALVRNILAAVGFALFPLAAAIAAPCPPDPAGFQALRSRVLHPPPGQVIIVAHRGCFAAAPENTPLAIRHCAGLGVEVVENDVRANSDGELFVLHDDTVDRVTNGTGRVDALTSADMHKLRMRDGSGGKDRDISNEPVPTLREYFRAAKHRVMINLELKPSGAVSWNDLLEKALAVAREEGVVDHLLLKVPDLNHHGRRLAAPLLESTRFPADVALLPMIWQSDTPIGTRLDRMDKFGGVGYEIPVTDPAYLGQVRFEKRLAGRPVMAIAMEPRWSGGLDDALSLRNPDAGWGQLIDLGANLVMTDHPEALLAYLVRKGMRPAPERPCP